MKLKIKNIKYGFTLIELIVSAFIIGILASIAIPYYNKYIQHSEINSNLTSLNFYRTSIVICLQTKTDYRLCNGGKYSIPEDFSDGSVTGIQSIKTSQSIIEVVSKTFLPDLNDYVKIKYKPISKSSVFEWEISCNDYNVGTIVDNCSKQYEEAK